MRRHHPRVLFIARAYPPTLGGMERFAFQLRSHLGAHATVIDLINRHGKKALPAFLPYALIEAARIARRGEVDLIHLADASLAPLGVVLKRVTGVPVTASVCGLDVTYRNRAYQALVPRSLALLDWTMPISAATEAAMKLRTGDRVASTVIPLGVNAVPAAPAAAVERFRQIGGIRAGDSILVTVGRLIPRKGVAWFVREVMPRLAPNAAYVVIGEGPDARTIAGAVASAGVQDRVRLIGRVSDEMVAAAYAASDVFVMPNVPVAGDMEGFGLVALEAASSGLPVVAARLEGITEAVHDGGNGVLVTPGDASGFAAAIERLIAMSPDVRQTLGRAAAQYTSGVVGWDATARRYAEIMRELCRGRSTAELDSARAA